MRLSGTFDLHRFRVNLELHEGILAFWIWTWLRVNDYRAKGQLGVYPHGAMEEVLKRYFTTVCEPQTAYEVTVGIPAELPAVELALDSLVGDGSLVCKEVGGGTDDSCCTRVYWHGNAEAVHVMSPQTPLQTASETPSFSKMSTATTPSPMESLSTSITSTPPGGIRPPSKRSRMPFKSPVTKLVSATTPLSSRRAASGKRQEVQDAETLAGEVVALRKRLEEVEEEINSLESYSEEELQAHIDKLHEYNEVKDIGQLLLGKLAEVEGTTTASLYEQFGLGLED